MAFTASDELITGEAVALDVRPAGFLLRALGGAIDVALSVLAVLCFQLVIALAGRSLDASASAALTVASLVVAIVVLPVVVEVLSHGRSLGRLAVGARIVRDDGGAAGLRHAFIRALAGAVEIFGTAGGLAVIVALLNPRAKRLGDLLAGTYSQHERLPRAAASGYGMPPLLEGWATTADVASLPDPLARRITRYLEQNQQLSWQARGALGEQLAAEASAYVSPLPQRVDPVILLAGVMAVRRGRELRALQAQAQRLALLAPTLGRRPQGFPER